MSQLLLILSNSANEYVPAAAPIIYKSKWQIINDRTRSKNIDLAC